MIWRSFAAFPLLGLTLISILGCGGGDSGPTLYPVTGKLTKGGQPFSGVTVTLSPTEGKGSVGLIATTKDDGTFDIITPQGGRGAPEGTYRVVLSKTVEVDYSNPKAKPTASEDIPKKLQSAQSSDQVIDVKKGGPNTIEIAL
ncbi:hypothetical protein GC163_16985 [bacterium]|nr:hypothetical protein [bacterium]